LNRRSPTNKKSHPFGIAFFYLAEKGGFEPPEPVSQFGCLANNWFQPLTHFSEIYDFEQHCHSGQG
jgi:hypothetical protein